MDRSSRTVLVCDIGTGYLKCGVAGSSKPTSTISTIVGRPLVSGGKGAAASANAANSLVVTGNEAVRQSERLQLTHPIENGVIRNWEDMRVLLNDTFTAKDVFTTATEGSLSAGRKVILTEAPMNPIKNRERLCEILFEEQFGVDAIHISTQAVLSLYAKGLMTGVVIDVGDGVSHIVPVYQGSILSHLTRRLNVAGRSITRHLAKLMFLQGYTLTPDSDYDTLQKIKERCCYVSSNVERDRRLCQDTTTLVRRFCAPSEPRTFSLSSERFLAPEILFSPEIIDIEQPGLSQSAFEVINGADIDLRPDLYRSIVLSGGTTLLPGIGNRISQDVRSLYSEKILKGAAPASERVKIRVDSGGDRRYSVFAGASVLADIMKDRDDFWIWKSEWNEMGKDLALSRLKQMGI